MKKKIALLLAAAVTMSAMAFNAFAAGEDVKLQLNGAPLATDQPAVIVNDRTMVPVRVVAEALNVEVNWDAATKTATFVKDDLNASLAIGSDTLNVTEGSVTVPVKIDSPAVIINERTMVPVRFLSETFDCQVDWDEETRTVNIIAESVDDNVATPAAVAVEVTEETTEATTEEGSTEETTEAATEEGSTEETTEAATGEDSTEETTEESSTEEGSTEETTEETTAAE